MSWDIVLMKTHTNSEPLDANINFVPFERDSTVRQLHTLFPELNVSNQQCLLLEDEIALEIYMGDEEMCETITLMFHGSTPPEPFIAAICNLLSCRAFDISSGEFLDLPCGSRFSTWNDWRNEIVKDYQ